MKNFRSLIFFSFLIAILSACNHNKLGKKKDIDAINAIFINYIHYANTGDLDSFMMLWEDDAKRIVPEVPIIEGKDNIRAIFENVFESANLEMIPIGQPEICVRKDIAYSQYIVSVIKPPEDGSPVQTIDIRGLSIFRRQKNGNWKIYIDCLNFIPTVPEIPRDSLEREEPSIYY